MHKFDPSKLDRILNPERRKWQNPDLIFDALGLGPGMSLADIGSGPGFFALPAAKRVGPRGKVYALDIQPEMLDKVKELAAAEQLGHIEALISEENRLPLPDACVDTALIANTVHELLNPVELLKEAARVLKPGGVLGVVEWRQEPMEKGPPVEERLSPDQVGEFLCQAGYGAVEAFEAGPYHYGLRARRSSFARTRKADKMRTDENTVSQWHASVLGKRVVEALKKNGFEAAFFPQQEEAVEFILSLIKPGDRIGLAGSETIRELRLPELAEAKGAKLVGMPPPGAAAGSGEVSHEEAFELARQRVHSDVYLTGTNAVTLDGYLVNVDGSGTRVSALTFGPKMAIVVVGVNKIVPDVESAFRRIETVAGPMNSRRLRRPNPCVQTGTCSDCQGEGRICRIYSVIKKKARFSEITVVVIGENLGY